MITGVIVSIMSKFVITINKVINPKYILTLD